MVLLTGVITTSW